MEIGLKLALGSRLELDEIAMRDSPSVLFSDTGFNFWGALADVGFPYIGGPLSGGTHTKGIPNVPNLSL